MACTLSRWRLATRAVHAGVRRDPQTGAVSMPIYQCATFQHPGLGQSTGYDYSRTKNPTRSALEEALAALEGGAGASAFASGMAAVQAVLSLLRPGDHVVLTWDLYGGTYRLFRYAEERGIRVTFVDTSDTAQVAAALTSQTRLILVETPTNPCLRIADLRALAQLARQAGVLLAVDNTFMTPLLQRPLDLGADLVVYSATKYLAGHNDVVAGAVVCRTPELAERIAWYQNAAGAILGPQDAWLTLRGLKTLHLRLARAQANAALLARWLSQHPRVTRVYYPGLSGHPGAALHAAQAAGPGAMLAFEVDSPGRVAEVLSRVELILFAESLGGVETLITYPWTQTHADIPAAERRALGISDRLLRLSVGVEDPADLVADLARALGGEAPPWPAEWAEILADGTAWAGAAPAPAAAGGDGA